jgi:27-O-demethylrifamycin SV methyltransferase
MTDPALPVTEPAAHYDRVTEAWRLLLGEALHYGVFERGDEPLDAATQALTDRMTAAARFEPGQRVLDVGCGTGEPARHLVATQGVQVLGISTSQVGVEIANRRAGDEGIAGAATFEVRDGTDNGLPDASFDRAWVLESSHLMPDRGALLAECARVLRPGGRVVLCDIIRRREIPFREVRNRMADFVVLREVFGDARMESLEVYGELSEQAGLTVESAEDMTDITRPTFARWRANLVEHRDEVVRLLGAEGADAFERSTHVLEGFWRDGTLGYGLFTAVKPAA